MVEATTTFQRAGLMNLKQVCTASLVASLMLLVGLYTVAATAEQPPTVVIRIESSGIVEVTVKASISEGLTVLPAPVEPIVSTITAKVNGTPVPAVYSNGSIVIASDRQGIAVVDYYANTTSLPNGLLAFNVSYEGNYTLVIEPGIILADIPENIAGVEVVNGSLLMLITGPTRIEYTVATAPPPPATTTTTSTPTTATATTTPQQPQTKTTATTTTTAPPTRTTTQTTVTVTSTVTRQTGTTTATTMVQQTTTATPAATATRTTTTTSPAATTATQRATTTAQTTTLTPEIPAANTAPTTPTTPAAGAPTTTPTARKGPSTLGVAVAVAIALAAILALLAVLRGRGGGGSALISSKGSGGGPGEGGGGGASVEPVLVTLDTTDKLILEKLREAGGSMYQSELQKATGLPKTTVWRHVRRLAQLGYVRVEREGKYNKVILLKYPEEGSEA